MRRPRLTLLWVIGVAAAIVVLAVLVRLLPLSAWLELLAETGEGGLAGALVFAAAYTAGMLLFVPASLLTLSAGALFGPWAGIAIVWPAATVAAAIAFALGRTLLRERTAAAVCRRPRLAAIDRAIGEGGWRIVALLRLSPAVPFSASNYVFGITPVRFWPYVGASALGMLPGGFAYIYVGHAGGAGVRAAFGAGLERPWWHWLLIAVGVAATLVVMVYITRRARAILAEESGRAARPAADPAARC